MTDIAIRVENLGKMYRIGTEDRRPATFWQAARQLAASPFAYLQRITRPPTEAETLWALKDVSFEVQRGEVVGIIGRNGAGKSTLLKILSRITEPTHGHAQIHGRVGSLLEVGTGFHPELTGRENIYLNGAILGMKRVEIDRKFDEIVAFAEIERFLDTPVKRYSSGMYVRLAFAVAAHLEPEILLVDEVLAVGDVAFQKKCLGKMQDVAKEGRTVIFVSHNMGAVSQLCERAILLDSGTVKSIGDVDKVISEHINLFEQSNGHIVFRGDTSATTKGKISFCALTLEDQSGRIRSRFFVGESLVIRARINSKCTLDDLQASFIIRSGRGIGIYHCMTRDANINIQVRPGEWDIIAEIKDLRLYPGQYWIADLWIADYSGATLDLQREGGRFEVVEGGPLVKRRLANHAAIIYEVPHWSVESAK